MDYNGELQKIDNHDKAYLLGLFYSDGNIGKNNSDVKLYLKDKELIFKLKDRFKFFNVYDHNNCIGIHKTVKNLKDDFILNGCLPDKSRSNKENIRIPFYNEFTSSFIRGYFDGDGGCSLIKDMKKIEKRVYIYSASNILLNEIKELFHINDIESTLNKTRNIYILTIKTNSYKKFYYYLYKNCNLYLERKRNKFNEILETKIFIKGDSPKCKYCNSTRTVFNGKYKFKGNILQRILCRECKNCFNTALINSNINNGGDELLEN